MNLTEIHRASGKSSTYKPIQWIRKEGSTFLASQQEKVPVGHLLIRSEKGRNGGTFAHWQIGMEYARYLSPDLAAVCNQIVKDFVDAKPEIAQSSRRGPPRRASLTCHQNASLYSARVIWPLRSEVHIAPLA